MNYTRARRLAAKNTPHQLIYLVLGQVLLITLNGEPYTLQGDDSLYNLLDQIGLRGKRVAVEHNGNIIPRSQHVQLTIKPGDVLEIVQAIGGG